MHLNEWLKEGKRIYGIDYANWKFVCPKCGKVQSVNSVVKEVGRKTFNPKRKDFAGNTLPCVYQECTDFDCDYASTEEKEESKGLIKLTGESDEGEETKLLVFEFADKE